MDKDEIRKLRHAIAVNRETFGQLIGVSRSSVEHYELGTRHPSKSVIMNLKRIKLMHEKGVTWI